METLEQLQIERDHAKALDHARGMYHMTVQAAENELDAAIAAADAARDARLAQARRRAHRAAQVAC